MIWAGHLNEYSKFAGPRLPKNIMIQVWGYDANWPATYGKDSIEYWSKLGFETTVMPWDNLRNVQGWAQVVADARKKGYPCLGMIDSCWAKRTGGIKGSAIVSWKIPKKSEKGFVELKKKEN